MFKHKMNLHLFDGGAPGGAAPEGGQGSTSDFAPGTNDKAEPKVVYGRTEESAAKGGEDADPNEERRNKFKELVSTEFKGEYEESIKGHLDTRMKNTTKQLESMQQKLQGFEEVNDILSAKYKVDDPAQLKKSLMNDETFWESEADKAGMTVEQFTNYITKQREAEKVIAQQKAEQVRQKSQMFHDKIVSDAEALKQKYPNFDLGSEIENPKFKSLIVDNGWGVEEAFEAVHARDLLSYAAQSGADRTREVITENIQARGQRPSENGMSQQGGVVRKVDVNNLTDDDLDEISRRVKKGEKISW
jgi:hypothetical protein